MLHAPCAMRQAHRQSRGLIEEITIGIGSGSMQRRCLMYQRNPRCRKEPGRPNGRDGIRSAVDRQWRHSAKHVHAATSPCMADLEFPVITYRVG